jgi:hypothetical protein
VFYLSTEAERVLCGALVPRPLPPFYPALASSSTGLDRCTLQRAGSYWRCAKCLVARQSEGWCDQAIALRTGHQPDQPRSRRTLRLCCAPELRALPDTTYGYAEWRRTCIDIGGRHYSVPSKLISSFDSTLRRPDRSRSHCASPQPQLHARVHTGRVDCRSRNVAMSIP